VVDAPTKELVTLPVVMVFAGIMKKEQGEQGTEKEQESKRAKEQENRDREQRGGLLSQFSGNCEEVNPNVLLVRAGT
jgi:hypothetical protein